MLKDYQLVNIYSFMISASPNILMNSFLEKAYRNVLIKILDLEKKTNVIIIRSYAT